MKTRYGCCLLLFLALSLLVLIACEPPEAASPEAAAATEPPPAEPTPLPAAVRTAIDDFAMQQDVIDSEWALLRDEFDQWNAELTACQPGAMRAALNEFAIGFNGLTAQARNITRTQPTSELADLLIAAAEAEEAAFRQLRDHWQPNNIALFEQVEEARAQASRAQAQAEDKANELRHTFEEAPDADSIAEFSQAFDAVKSDWQALHDEYTELREEAEAFSVDEVLKGLNEIVKKSSDIINALDELPPLEGTESAVDDLLSAAKAERKEFRTAAKPVGGSSSSSTTGSSGSAASGSAGEGEGGEEESDSAAQEEAPAPELPDFTAADESVEAGETALKQATRLVHNIADLDVERSLAQLQTFNTEHRRLRSDWDDFHDAYNEWRANDGGCNHTAVTQSLDQFNLRIGSLGRDVRALPQSGYLLPIHALLVAAVAREENALRTLRYTWRPFASDAFKAVYEQRTAADRLRREAGIALEELRGRF